MDILRDFILSRDFQIAFWSTILSSLIVSGLIALAVYQYTDFFKTPKLTFVVKQGQFYSDKVILSERADGDYEASFRLSIKNYGSEVFKAGEGYWHIYFPNASRIENIGGSEIFHDPEQKTHLRNVVDLPIYPHSFTDLGPEYKLLIKRENISQSGIRFFFETSYGHFPNSIEMDPNTGAVAYEKMGLIEVVAP
jgi:hypothetical protein